MFRGFGKPMPQPPMKPGWAEYLRNDRFCFIDKNVCPGDIFIDSMVDCSHNGFRSDFLDEFGRDTSPKFIRTDLGLAEYERAGGDNGARTHMGFVKDGRSHADQAMAVNPRRMDGCVMADNDVVRDDRFQTFSC